MPLLADYGKSDSDYEQMWGLGRRTPEAIRSPKCTNRGSGRGMLGASMVCRSAHFFAGAAAADAEGAGAAAADDAAAG